MSVSALVQQLIAEQLERAVRLDCVDRDRIRQLTADDHVLARGIDAEAARLLLGRRAQEVRELAAGGVDAERADRSE